MSETTEIYQARQQAVAFLDGHGRRFDSLRLALVTLIALADRELCRR